MKSVNLQYFTLGWFNDGTNESLSKSLMFQILFFFSLLFIDLGHSKLVIFIFVISWKNKKIFAKKFARNHEKKIALGTSDTWSTNQSINNILRVDGSSFLQMNQRPSIWCSKTYFFFFTISCKILCKNNFNLFFYKIKSLECSKSISNYKKE